MAKYLTPSQYKRYSDGIDLSTVSDLNLAMMISRAETAIDAHMGFDAKRGGFEPHTIMLQQAFREHSRRTFFPTYEVPVRVVNRYRIQVSNVSGAGAGFFANINPGDCVINNDGAYVEIVPLQAITYALSPVIIALGLRTPIVQMDCEVGFYIPIFGEQLINGGLNTQYFAINGFWAQTYNMALAAQPMQLPPAPPVIYKNGVVQTTGFTIDYTDGSVTFATPLLPTDTVSADYTYVIPDPVTEACVLQTSFLLAQKSLNEMKMYHGLFQMRTGEQEISYPRNTNVADQGRTYASSLCPDAAAVMTRMVDWAIA